MKTFKQYLENISSNKLEDHYGMSANQAYQFVLDFKRYGLAAFDEHFTPEQQVQAAQAYAFVYR